MKQGFVSILHSDGANLYRLNVAMHRFCISTHSHCAGRTHAGMYKYKKALSISTHSPRVGRTKAQQKEIEYQSNLNSLAPCGANPRNTYDKK